MSFAYVKESFFLQDKNFSMMSKQAEKKQTITKTQKYSQFVNFETMDMREAIKEELTTAADTKHTGTT